MEPNEPCISCHSTGMRIKSYDHETNEFKKGTCETCGGTGTPLEQYKDKWHCPLSDRSYTHIDLYQHWPSKTLEKGDLLISHTRTCEEDNPICNGLRERLASLTKEERYALFNMAQQVDDMLSGAVVSTDKGPVLAFIYYNRTSMA